MRYARLKPSDQDTWHHCYNRVVGNHHDRPLDDADKEQFVRILRRIAKLYTVRVVAYQVMSNHFHLLLQAPCAWPSEEETIERYQDFYDNKRTLTPGTKTCRQWQMRMRDISWFMRHLQHLYSAWYNRTRPVRRRGPLWAGRFKNTVLEGGTALWACWAYIECNPVRAGMVADAADYRFCSYGAWRQTGRHPFAKTVSNHLIPSLPASMRSLTLDEIRKELAKKLSYSENNRDPGFIKPATESDLPEFTLSASRRVRHWVDGLVIGSELFVRDTVSRYRPEISNAKHRLAKATRSTDYKGSSLCCWRRLRVMLN